MRSYPILLLLLIGLTGCQTTKIPMAEKPSTVQTAQHFEVQQTRTLAADYLLFLPDGYNTNSTQRWPLILFLHGAGERGNNIWTVAKHGPPKIDTQTTNFPFIVVSPQCPDGQIWSQDLLLALLDEIEAKYPVDLHRVYLTGLSMGGFGTWTFGLSHPDRFAAIAPLCGGGDTISPFLMTGEKKEALLSLPVWAFHGAKDPVVPMEESERMVGLLKRLGAHEVKLTIYPEAQHDCWTQTYANPELFEWFLKHSR